MRAGLLTVRDLAESWGLEPTAARSRQLRRMIRRRERQTGEVIAVRLGGRTSPVYVTMGVMRKFFPEFFEGGSVDGVGTVEYLEDEIASVRADVRGLSARLNATRAELRRLAG